MIKFQFLALTFLIASFSGLQAKRKAPEPVAPIVTKEAVYSVEHYGFKNGVGQNGGVVLAHDPETNKLLWSAIIYEREPLTERTKSTEVDVFIASLSFDRKHGLLIIADERGRRYVLDVDTQKVTKLEE